MKAVIMAGGFGTRIQPLTNSIPKPMLPVVNIPMMEYSIRKLSKIGIKDFVILLYFKPEVIQNYFKDGREFGVNITYALPDKDYGTAGAVRYAKDCLDTTFVVVSGDLMTDCNFQDIINFHKKNISKLTIGITRVENPLQFGVVVTDEAGKIERFLEKPSWGEVINDKINTGIYVISPDVLDFIPADKPFDFSKDLFPLLMDSGVDLWGYTLEGYWRDVGNITSYLEIHEDIFNNIVKVDFEKDLTFERKENGELYIGKNCTVHNSVKVTGNVVLGTNVYIGEGVLLENCVIGDNVVIKSGSVIKNSVVWNDVNMGELCYLKRSIVCNDVNIGNRVDIKEGCVVSEFCNIGDNVEVLKDVIIWPHKFIDDNAIVNRNVIWGDQYKSNVISKGSIEGTSNIELTGDISSKIAEAFGSIFPVGSNVYVGRDYYKSSRMIKRFIMGGLLSVGVNVIDLEVMSPNILRYKVFNDENAVGGVHIRHSVSKQNRTKINFFTKEGLYIDDNIAKSIEKIYFSEKFRRVNPSRIGDIVQAFNIKNDYKKDVLNKIDRSVFLDKKPKVVVDLMHGMLSDIYPDILGKLGIKSIIINAYPEDENFFNTSEKIKESRNTISQMVKDLSFDMGLILYPNGQKMEIVADDGTVLEPYKTLLAVVYALYLHDRKKFKVFLPPWAPDIWDATLSDVEIYRGRLMGKDVNFLKNFDFIGDTDGHYDFTSFGFHSDSVFASIKIMELLSYSDMQLSDIIKKVPNFYYKKVYVSVPSSKKASIMRKIADDAKTKSKVTYNSGIRIYFDEFSWLFAIPDDAQDVVKLYIQAKDSSSGVAIEKEYSQKIEQWIE
jgi:mannose-1-phosphate guanylyltransferase/phosphomannomutase